MRGRGKIMVVVMVMVTGKIDLLPSVNEGDS
jgi:hypothetical protein